MTASYVALFRGINVSGYNKIDKATLIALFTNAGVKNVQTYIQSGNVLFTANAKLAASIPTLICTKIKSQLGIDTNVTLRTAAELQSIQARNPYAIEDRLYVAFLSQEPAPDRISLLDPNRSLPDQFTVSGREIYLRLETGATKTKLTNAWFDSKLQTVSTMRNWRTVVTLSEMMSS